ncbi:MAG: hypothetical protein MnENMB40S_28640 [Rhizobiaceae bacterium MnEN-MB40S]|nr:MAG: hypothetical protein MnENMB40S_28640 [Rhizobiaceae bacterium MnEN-MB40S]
MDQDADHRSYLLGDTESAVYRYRLFNRVHEPATRDRMATLNIAPDAHVLEVGCGIGETACLFATELVPAGHVVAFDRAPELVETARQTALERGIDNITFVCSDAAEFDFGSERFDLAHTRFVLSYLNGAAEIVGKIFGAMKKGGLFFGEEIVQSYVLVGETAAYEPFCKWFGQLIEAGGGQADYGLRQLPADVLASGFTDMRATAQWPLEDQSLIVEMVGLALASEMKHNLTRLGIASEAEIDAAVAALNATHRNFTVSPAMVAQIIGRKP